jgi:hypothetical protein
MANGQGFMIPLNATDWTNGGVRNNWCAAPNAWWTNENIKLVGGLWGETDAAINQQVTITIGVQGLVDPDGPSVNAIVNGAQAWACLPSPTAGYAGALVPSMGGPPTPPPPPPPPSPPPIWAGAQQLTPSSNPSQYRVTTGTPPGSPPPFAWIPVGHWTPQPSDIVAPNTTTHCCVIANCWGVADASGPIGNPGGHAVGQQIPPDLAGINVCTDIYQGQRNMTIVPASGPPPQPHLARFGFVAVNPSLREPAEVILDVRPIVQERLDPSILRALEGGPYRDLKFKPVAQGAKTLRLLHNEHKQERGLAELLHEAEDIREEPMEELSHLTHATSRLRVKLPPKGIHPLLCEVQLEPGLPPGSVHVCDITQTDPDKRRGGIRLVTVVVPQK